MVLRTTKLDKRLIYRVTKRLYIADGLEEEAVEYNLRKMVDIVEYDVDESKQKERRKRSANARR